MKLKAQSKWRWGVAVYLFLLGLGAGSYVTGVFADFMGAGWVLLSIGAIVLLSYGIWQGLMELMRPTTCPSTSSWRSWRSCRASWCWWSRS